MHADSATLEAAWPAAAGSHHGFHCREPWQTIQLADGAHCLPCALFVMQAYLEYMPITTPTINNSDANTSLPGNVGNSTNSTAGNGAVCGGLAGIYRTFTFGRTITLVRDVWHQPLCLSSHGTGSAGAVTACHRMACRSVQLPLRAMLLSPLQCGQAQPSRWQEMATSVA